MRMDATLMQGGENLFAKKLGRGTFVHGDVGGPIHYSILLVIVILIVISW